MTKVIEYNLAMRSPKAGGFTGVARVVDFWIDKNRRLDVNT